MPEKLFFDFSIFIDHLSKHFCLNALATSVRHQTPTPRRAGGQGSNPGHGNFFFLISSFLKFVIKLLVIFTKSLVIFTKFVSNFPNIFHISDQHYLG